MNCGEEKKEWKEDKKVSFPEALFRSKNNKLNQPEAIIDTTKSKDVSRSIAKKDGFVETSDSISMSPD